MSAQRKLAAFLHALQQRLLLDKRWQIAVGVALVIVIASALALGPLVRSVAQSRAEARGLEIQIGGVRPGWFRIWLKDTEVRLHGVSAVSARLDALGVGITPFFGLRRVDVRGGQVELEGTLDEVQAQLERWRASRPKGDDSGTSSERGRLPLSVEGVSLAWKGLNGAHTHVITGARLERDDEHTLAGFDTAKLESAWGRIEANAGSVELAPGSGLPALRSLRVAELVGRVTLPDSRDDAPSEAAPSTPPLPAAAAAGDTADKNGRLQRGATQSKKRAASDKSKDQENAAASRWLAPRQELSWPEHKARLDELRALVARVFPDGATIDLARVQLEIARGSSLLNVGPAPFHLDREGDLLSASFTSAADKDGKRLTVKSRFPLNDAPIDSSFEGGPITLQTLGVHEGDFGLLGTDRTELTLATRVELSTEGVLWVSASGQLHQLALQRPALAPEPLRDMDLSWAGQVSLDLARHELALKEGSLGLERVRVYVEGSMKAEADALKVSLSVQVPETPCQDLLEAAPHALLPQLDGLRLGGSFGLDFKVAFDSSAPKDADVEWNFDNECKVLEMPEAVDPRRFREPFQHFVQDAEGRATEIVTGPTTDQWVPLSDISPNMETALIVCEDSRFFSHKGFDNKAIRDSIIDNLRAGRFVRGASTLSMQLAKNLYLGREKTLSRKLQEAAFTLLLEERLSKEDILELYLNVVEFGPGIYGIRNAASHYFNSHPGELSLAQALYLGSVLPSPKANHFERDGALRAGWAEHLHYLMRIARKINRINDEELEAGLSEQLMFGQAHPSSGGDFLFGTPADELRSDG